MSTSNNYQLLTEKRDKEVVIIFTTDGPCLLSTYRQTVVIKNTIG